jgi:acyl-CoA thioesterase
MHTTDTGSDHGSFPMDIPFLNHVGVRFLGASEGRAEVSLALRLEHMNSWDVTHGGVTMAMMDVAMAFAGRSLDAEARTGVTIEMKTSFLQPGGKPGDVLVAKAHAFHRSSTMCFCESELWNGDRLVAKSTGTFKYLRRAAAFDKPG